MCGLVGCSRGSERNVEAALHAMAHRGPDGSGLISLEDGGWLGHVRLAIQDPTPASAQPFIRGEIALTYVGELWNAASLRSRLKAQGETFTTTGDTEVVAAALDRWGPEALRYMEGMWALAWEWRGLVFLARDRFGEIPLHTGRTPDGLHTWWASEMKGLLAAGARPPFTDVGPGELWTLGAGPPVIARWYAPAPRPVEVSPDEASRQVRRLLAAATTSRALAADVPVCTLLSGGIDSAAVAYELAQLMPDVTAYTAVLDKRSRDLRCARAVADAIGVKLVEVEVSPPSADDLARVVRTLELPFKAQVEIGWACLFLAERIRDDGAKVTFSGEGSDELWASYGMSHHGIERYGWHDYRTRLVLDQARKNFPRCNKAFMARSVEVRLPFVDRALVEYGLALPRSAVAPQRSRPKAVLCDAYAGLLPDEVVRRPKVAFQTGMGLQEAAASVVADPRRYYAAEHRRTYGPVA